MDVSKVLRKENNKWIYKIEELMDFVEKVSVDFTGKRDLQKSMGVNKSFLDYVEKKHNIKFNYNFRMCKNNYKAIYQDYDWCYQKYIVERKSHEEMANELGVTKRVVQKWCVEIHKLNRNTIKKHLKLNDIQTRLIKASVLGDGHIVKRESQPIFIVSHAENQKEYLYWKYDILKNLCNKEPVVKEETIKPFGDKSYLCQRSYRLNTKIIDDLRTIREMTTIDIFKEMDEFMLSIFILDDGYRDKTKWELCLADYNSIEKDFFINICKDKFGLNLKFKKDERYVLFDRVSSEKIDSIILSNMPNDLDIIKYKILKVV